MEGEGLGDLVACDDVRRQTTDTLGAVPYCNITRCFKILHWTLPPSVYLPSLPDVTTGGGEGQGMRFATRYASELEVGKFTRLK